MRFLCLKNTRNWLRKKLFRKRVLLLAIGIGVPWLWVAWQCFGPLSPITISAETTILTEPLTADGRYVDYLTWAREHCEPANARLAREDRWCLLAGLLERTPEQPKDLPIFVEFDHAFKGWLKDHPEFEQDWGRISGFDVGANQVHAFPLQESSHPEIAKFLKVNEPWYTAVTDSEPTFAKFECSSREASPYFARALLNRSQEYRNHLARRFAIRAALQFHAGEFEAGLRDAQIMLKAAEHCETFCLIGLRVSWIIRQEAYEEIMKGLLLCHKIDDAAYVELLRLPIDFLDKELDDVLDGPQRFVLLDSIQRLHRAPMADLGIESLLPRSLQSIARRFAGHQLDFEQLMRSQNRLVDQVMDAIRQPSYREQTTAMDIAINHPKAKVPPAPFSFSFFAHDFQTYVEQHLITSSYMKALPEAVAKQKNIRRLLHLAVRLALWKRTNGSYPERLSDVVTMPSLPPVSEVVLIDAFTDQPFAFERVGELYRIRSAGPDMVLDSGSSKPIHQSTLAGPAKGIRESE